MIRTVAKHLRAVDWRPYLMIALLPPAYVEAIRYGLGLCGGHS